MRGAVFLQGFFSFLIVAFGQPSFGPWLGPIAAALGYALFWRGIRIYPFSSQKFWRASLWFASVSLIQLSWMSSIQYQGVYILFVWLGLCLWLGVQFGLLSIVIAYNRPLTFPRILAIASLWTLLEWSRFQILCGYSWNPVGLSLSHIWAIQWASIFGILGLSFWVIFVNLLALRAFLRRGIFPYVVWGLAAFIPYLFGYFHISYHDAKMAKENNLSCVLVQTGLLPPEKVPLSGKVKSFISPYDQWRRILTFLKEKQKPHTDLVVLPEAVVPFVSSSCVYKEQIVREIFTEVFGPSCERAFPEKEFPFGDEVSHKVSNAFWTQTISNLLHSEVILGLDHVDAEGKSFSCAFHAQPEHKNLDRYDKRVLVPLAEYLPFKWLSPLVKHYGIQDFFTHGEKANVFEGKVPISVSICYEETFPEHIRRGRLNGAKLLVNVTNDGWYPFSRLPSQHYEHAKFRAVENGTPLIRACNTGVSAAIDSLGRSVAKLEECDKKKTIYAQALYTKINTYEYPTLYMFWGNGGILSLCLIFLGGFLVLKKELYW